MRETSEASQKYLLQVPMTFPKYPTKMVSCVFRRVIEISDKIDVGPSETLKKWNVFWKQCIAINQIGRKYQWTDICVMFMSIVCMVCKSFENFGKLNSRCIIGVRNF